MSTRIDQETVARYASNMMTSLDGYYYMDEPGTYGRAASQAMAARIDGEVIRNAQELPSEGIPQRKGMAQTARGICRLCGKSLDDNGDICEPCIEAKENDPFTISTVGDAWMDALVKAKAIFRSKHPDYKALALVVSPQSMRDLLDDRVWGHQRPSRLTHFMGMEILESAWNIAGDDVPRRHVRIIGQQRRDPRMYDPDEFHRNRRSNWESIWDDVCQDRSPARLDVDALRRVRDKLVTNNRSQIYVGASFGAVRMSDNITEIVSEDS